MPAAKSATQPDSSPTLFKSAKAFETWLRKNHATSDGLWLKIAKRGANEPSVTYPEAVEIALCWGWIDGQNVEMMARFAEGRPDRFPELAAHRIEHAVRGVAASSPRSSW